MASRFVLLFFISWIASATALHAQLAVADSAKEEALQKEVIKLYAQETGANSLLYNGPEYIWLYPNTRGHPYFLSDTLQKGRLLYDSILYYDRPLLYEMVQQTIVTEGYQKTKIVLLPEKIQEFSIGDHVFKRINNTGSVAVENGFYEILFRQNEVEVLVKRYKEIRRTFSPEDPDVFTEFARYVLKKQNRYYPIDGESSLVQALSDKKAAIRKFLRTNRLSFKKDPSQAIVRTVQFYVQTNNE